MGDDASSLSLIIPAFNEARRIAGSLREIGAYLARQAYSTEIIVVDDGSRDGTSEVVREVAFGIPIPLVYLRCDRNRGKGHALRWGSRPRGASAFCSPMPISRPPSTRQRACSNGSRAGPIVAIGSRKTDGAAILVRQPWLREHLGKGFTFLTRALIADVSDATCGFKAFRGDVGRDLFAHCRIDGWGFDAELLLLHGGATTAWTRSPYVGRTALAPR